MTRRMLFVCLPLVVLAATLENIAPGVPVNTETAKTYFRRPASSPSADQKLEDLKASYAVEQIQAERFPTPQPMPAVVKQFLRDYKEFLLKRADDSYKETGIWFFCRARGHYATGWRLDIPQL